GVLGGRVGLPCNIQPNSTDDEVSLVLWYKDDSTTPIYSLDSRKTTLRNAHHSPAYWLEGRAYLQAITSGISVSVNDVHRSDSGTVGREVAEGTSRERVYTGFTKGQRDDASGALLFASSSVNSVPPGSRSPSLLQLDPLKKEDEALYRCRVDFKRARTRNYEVQLIVIDSISLIDKEPQKTTTRKSHSSGKADLVSGYIRLAMTSNLAERMPLISYSILRVLDIYVCLGVSYCSAAITFNCHGSSGHHFERQASDRPV
ncbi:hypothetical protein BIW11_06875, partial [Tropilaelaps mercedesae]